MYPNMNMRRNPSWDYWGPSGVVLGICLIIIGLATQILEYPRIYNGVTNQGNGNPNEFLLYNIANYYNHWWPWTYAASLFGLFTFLAGLMGFMAGMRRSYGSILSFFVMTLFSMMFAIYLIVYFAIIIGFYRSNGKDKSSVRQQTETISYALAATQLALACVNVLISFMATIVAGRAIALCVPKGVRYDDVPQMQKTSPSYGIRPPSSYPY
jgi:hypothetical protein